MDFLYPEFLFALFAVGIPVLIHLFNFRKFRKVYFSNIQFLKEVEQKSSSGRKLKSLLILAARILAIVFLVLAFAKPYIPQGKTADLASQRLIGVYIDNSFSMETVNKDGSLLDAAKRRAKEIADSYSLNDKFMLITNDFEGKDQRLLSKEELIEAVDEVDISGASRTLQQVLGRVQDVFSDKSAEKVIYLLSDFQKNMFAGQAVKPDSTLAIRLIRLQANPIANISVDSVWFASPVHKPGESEKLIVRLKNNSDQKSKSIPVKVFIDREQKAIGNVTLEAAAATNDTLSFSGLTTGWKRGEIQISDYPVVFDDKFYFSFNVRNNVPVLAINESAPNVYLEAVYRSDPFFRLDNSPAGNINYSSLPDYKLIILNNFNSVSAGLGQQLHDYVENGGSLMIFPDVTGELEPLREFLQTLKVDVPERIVSEETGVTAVNLKNPFFSDVFERIPRNMDLPVAKKYIQYSTRSRTTKQSLLDLPGRRSLLSSYALGRGTIYLSAVPLNEEVSNLVRHSIFVPIMYRAVFLSLRDSRLFYVLGRDQFLETSKVSPGKNQVLKLKKGEFETIPDLRQTENLTRLFVADQIKEEGSYDLLKSDSLLNVFSFNNDRAESDLSYASVDLIKQKMPGGEIEILTPGNESIHNAIKSANAGIQLWKLCIILSLVFMAAEVLLIRFLKPSYTSSNLKRNSL